MKHLSYYLVGLCLLAFVNLQNTSAQVYQMVVDHVKPSMRAQYEDALKDYMKFHSENDYSYPMDVYTSWDLHYYYVTPMKSAYADLDTINMALSEMAKKDEEGYKKLFEQFNDTYFTSITSCHYLAKALSYFPSEEGNAEDDMTYIELWILQVKLGKANELNSLLKEISALYAEKEIPNPYYVYRGLIGMNQGTYMIGIPGKDPADLWERSMKSNEILGEQGKELNGKMMALLDKMEVKQLWWRKKLSYEPPKE